MHLGDLAQTFCFSSSANFKCLFSSFPPVEAKKCSTSCFCSSVADPYEATRMGNSCIQYIDKTYGDFVGLDMWNAQSPLSEDCLYLNIWTPRHSPAADDHTPNARRSRAKKAVMVQNSVTAV